MRVLDRLDEEHKVIESRATVAKSSIERERSGRSRSGDVGHIEQSAIQCFVWNVKQCSISTTSQTARKMRMIVCTCDAPSKKIHAPCTDAPSATSSGAALTVNDIAEIEGDTYRGEPLMKGPRVVLCQPMHPISKQQIDLYEPYFRT